MLLRCLFVKNEKTERWSANCTAWLHRIHPQRSSSAMEAREVIVLVYFKLLEATRGQERRASAPSCMFWAYNQVAFVSFLTTEEGHEERFNISMAFDHLQRSQYLMEIDEVLLTCQEFLVGPPLKILLDWTCRWKFPFCTKIQTAQELFLNMCNGDVLSFCFQIEVGGLWWKRLVLGYVMNGFDFTENVSFF